MWRRRPRALERVAIRQADLAGRLVDLLNLDLDLLAELQHIAGMLDAVPAQLADVQHAVDAAQIDERAEVADVADDAFALLPLGQLGEQPLLGFGLLALQHRAAAEHQIAAVGIGLGHDAGQSSGRRTAPGLPRGTARSG